MSTEKSDAIILRTTPFSESSLVVTMLTRDFGKISALAKGAYRPKSSFEGAIDLGCLCGVVFIRKSSGALSVMTEAKLQRRFRAGCRSLQQLYAGYYVIELLREFTEEEERHERLFQLADNALASIDNGGGSSSQLADVVASFELKMLTLLGHAPTMDRCTSCGQAIDSKGNTAFGMLSGGVLCPACRPRARQVVMLGAPCRDAMRERINDSIQTGDDCHKTPVVKQMRGVMSRYMSHQAGKPLKLTKLISGLVSNKDD